MHKQLQQTAVRTVTENVEDGSNARCYSYTIINVKNAVYTRVNGD